MTFRGAVVGWTPIAAGARGRERCRNDCVLTAMVGYFGSLRSREEDRRLLRRDVDLEVSGRPNSKSYVEMFFFGKFCVRRHPCWR
jgi:hypothetical protein